MARRLDSWLKALAEYVEDTEAPRQFWHWAGISTIASALQRKVWLPFGIENYYPNLYVLVAGPPASRKGQPLKVSKDLLTMIEIPVSRDSSSKRNLTEQLEETSKTEYFDYQGSTRAQSSMSIISKEMSSLLAVNPKEIVECMTDLYDCHDKWEYGTSKAGEDILLNVCVNALIATTPVWLSENLPESAIGGGFTSRFVIVFGDEVYKRVPRPELTAQQQTTWNDLVHDLAHISKLVGEFSWTSEATRVFDSWYRNIDAKIRATPDERLHPFIGRIHAMVLKTAMCLQVDRSDELVLGLDVIKEAIVLLEHVLATASDAFGGHGRSFLGTDTKRVITQLRTVKQATLRELMKMNWMHVSKTQLQEIVETICTMGLAQQFLDTESEQVIVRYKGKEGARE